MKLYIAEKPSLGRAIADVLPKPHKKQDGFIELGNGDCVTWCIGHLLEQAEPEDYDERYKKWLIQDLPIVPSEWKFKAKPKTKKQLATVKRLIKKASILVHAGDPDREGQLLVDEVIQEAKLSKTKKATVERVLISDLNPSAVKKALSQTKLNADFVPLSVSALARARADWLYGMNLTRAYTLAGQKAGIQGVLSVGRVQTPVLGLVVRRDEEIEHFVSKPFYEVTAVIRKVNGEQFDAKWVPSDACLPYMDEEKRVLVKSLAENVAGRIKDKPADLTALDQIPKKQNPPLPYNLSSLQIDANKRYAMSAKQVIDICQALYEKHKLITYPRSDNRYLPNDHYAERNDILAAILNNQGEEKQHIENADPNIKSKCWNDKKVEAHHAIIPTKKNLKTAQLGHQEQQVYGLICRQYLAQFYPPYEYSQTKAQLKIAGGMFVAKADTVINLGFKVLFKSNKKEQDEKKQLPQLNVGEPLHCIDGLVKEKHTQPPQFYTEATLLSAMTGIARYVKNGDIKKVLKETDGLGTEATRAGIIELLFKRRFLAREGKSIKSTDLGRGLINTIPVDLSLPDRTALWESQLTNIAQKAASYNQFMLPLQNELAELVDLSQTLNTEPLKGIKTASSFKRKGNYRKTGRRSTNKGKSK
ncbi:DNA topoisomerase III [Pseudoalteromonas luteoviolacea]|uniref:DNA topoisomerase III n=1 Tax=Pseudoalteromonas luteoviolacea TaxID=43657 RepID=UPI001B360671|nr:DNA topoisomerase III [Pseudoalteromonas luteoviolacea]MBQ4838910.1 DNA topoisomerase III [Pseudoalteromonas luteoviolacea]